MRWLIYLLMLWTGLAHGVGMGYDEARHLLVRTGFAPAESEIQLFARLTRQQAVDRVLSNTATEAHVAPPAWVAEPLPPRREIRSMEDEQRRMLFRELARKGFELRGWWYQEMIATPSPLTERMTLFWHNHFVSSLEKVKGAQLLYRQNVLLRQYALGNFGGLLHAIARDPAMVIYLDSASNRKGQPNENFAREVMELFTLGVGHYTEQDIKEAARAFTGWSLDRGSYEFRFYPFLHDGGVKTVLGRSGNLDGDEVLDVLLAQPATAEFVVTKLWREFVSQQPVPAEVKKLAGVFRTAHYEIKPVLRSLFLSDAFYAKENRASLIKSPVELLVGTVRQFHIEGLDPRLFALAGRQLGQDILAPPNVKGWPGGDDWINSTTLLGRKQIMARLFRAEEMPRKQVVLQMARNDRDERIAQRMENLSGGVVDVERFFAEFSGSESHRRTQAEKLLLAMPTSQPFNDEENASRIEFIRHLTLDPVYQLK